MVIFGESTGGCQSRLYRLRSGESPRSFAGWADAACPVAFSPDGRCMLVSGLRLYACD